MSEERKELRELCDKATQGDWWIDSHGHRMMSMEKLETIFITHGEAMGPATRNQETGNLSHWRNDWDCSYIVAVQPKVVRGLLDEIEQLKADKDELKSAKHTTECLFEVSEDTLSCIRGCLRAAEGDIDNLKQENGDLKFALNLIMAEGGTAAAIAYQALKELEQ